jgi:replicative DNA helicase
MTLNETYQWQLLARIIEDVDLYYAHADQIMPELFTGYQTESVFSTFLNILKSEKHPTIHRVAKQSGSEQAVMQALSNLDYSIPLTEIFNELEAGRRQRILRKFAAQCIEQDANIDGNIAELYKTIDRINLTLGSNFIEIGKIVDEVQQDMALLQQGITTGIKTGFSYFDTMTGGLQKTDLVIIAAEPSQGKTSLALNIAEYSPAKVAIISMEMGEKQLVQRMICSIAEIPKQQIMRPNPHYEDVAKFNAAAEVMRNKMILLADIKNSDISNIVGMVRAAVMRYSVEYVIIDYLQLIHNKATNSREQEIGGIARTLKNLAKELNIPIVVLSQLNRNTDSYPTLRRLRDSGQIEEAADIVWFIYRPEEYRIKEFDGEPTANLAIQIIAKGRNYGTGFFKTEFKRGITKFFNRAEPGGNLQDIDRSQERPF